MSTALIAIDDSDAATRALQYAMEAYDGIQIINVQIKAEVPIAVLRIGQDELDNMQLKHGRSQLVPARKLLVDAARPYREHVPIGDPAGKIVEVAMAEGVDAIVMGTRGMRAPSTGTNLGARSRHVVSAGARVSRGERAGGAVVEQRPMRRSDTTSSWVNAWRPCARGGSSSSGAARRASRRFDG